MKIGRLHKDTIVKSNVGWNYAKTEIVYEHIYKWTGTKILMARDDSKLCVRSNDEYIFLCTGNVCISYLYFKNPTEQQINDWLDRAESEEGKKIIEDIVIETKALYEKKLKNIEKI